MPTGWNLRQGPRIAPASAIVDQYNRIRNRILEHQTDAQYAAYDSLLGQKMDAVMDAAAQHLIQAQDLTDEAFAPYGDIIKPRLSGQQFDRAYAYDPSNENTHVKLVMTNGVPTLRLMKQRLRGLTFSKMARHRRVTQCLGSLQGKEWYMAVAAPTDDDTQLRLEDITAFRIPGDRIIKLHVGTWHAGPHFKHEECLFLNLENEDTNTKDFQDAVLPQQCCIKD